MPYVRNRKRNLSLRLKIKTIVMPLQLIFAIVIFISIIGMMVWFIIEKKEVIAIHNQNVSTLKKAISTNRDQINFRNNNLNTYHFLQYNLQEALTLQTEIKLKYD